MDFELLFSHPLYLTKLAIRHFVALHGADFRGNVLDVGCGSGRYQKFLHDGIHYVGLELNIKLRPDVGGSALDLPFRNGAFDNVISLEVLEHLPEPERALSEMARVMRPGGKLILTTPMTWYLHYEPHDYYRFTHYGLTYLMEKVGFRVISIERTGGLGTVFLLHLVETVFHWAYALTLPLRWLTGKDRGRWRTAVLLTLPVNLLAIALRPLVDSKRGLYVQGWMVLAEKKL